MALLKQSDRVREIVLNQYVRPVVESGETRFSVRARDVLKCAEAGEGFPRGRTPLICNVLQSQKLLRAGGLEIEGIDGPPSRQSRTVVVHYRVVGPGTADVHIANSGVVAKADRETPEEWALRLTDKIRGLMKDEIASHGGTEGYMRWVRSEDDEDAA